ncbi:MAG: polyphosphate kinase 1 [Coriobacteriia bacterium]|nr:polyphosphate kinase 1 [Coriobacteriia bacterium]MCL2537233.1 polyphosphate kinase 1 [Coriobacteriia bacterium]
MSKVCLKHRNYMQNRELSWLRFNERVLLEATRAEVPLLERLRYISIFANNLDEFFMIRVGSLTDHVVLDEPYVDGRTGMNAQEQIDEILSATKPHYQLMGQAYDSVVADLAAEGVHFCQISELSSDEVKALTTHFEQNIAPLLSPQIIGANHPFPHLTNKQIHVACIIKRKNRDRFGIIPVPNNIDRLVVIPGDGLRIVLLEDIILHHVNQVFSTQSISEKVALAVTRNADITLDEDKWADEDESVDFRKHMKELIKRRQRLAPVRLEVNGTSLCPTLQNFLCEKLKLDDSSVFFSHAPLDFSSINSVSGLLSKESRDPLVWPARIPAESLSPKQKRKVIKLVEEKDLLVTYPYESMSTFFALIREAAESPDVHSIKITLYRIGAHSQLAQLLMTAAENGKEVIVVLELRARFDEKNNIEWAQRLEDAGCRVIYGLPAYKVHAKICLITKKSKGEIKHIAQISTGNYNELTARIYTDLNLFTADKGITADAALLFNSLLLGEPSSDYSEMAVAPTTLKSTLLDFIKAERKKALAGKPARILFKCNSLSDKKIMKALSAASQDGVEVILIVRGVCCLLPGVKGYTDNIRVISIVGRYLEHIRVYCFGAEGEEKVYMSSADLMTRNTERRIEIACPILDKDAKAEILDILMVQLRDTAKAWELKADGSYRLVKPAKGDEAFNSQEYMAQRAHDKAP